MRVKIVRHSERLDFKYPWYWLFCVGHYWSDSPLTSNGHAMAEDKAKQLLTDGFSPKIIYTSPYSRTMETAARFGAIFKNSEIIVQPLLSEYQPKYKHTIDLYPSGIPTDYEGKSTYFSFPESYDSFSNRIKFIVTKLIDKNNDDILLVTHGEVVKIYISHLQTMFPEIILNPDSVPYLTALCFDYDKTNNKIIGESIKIE